MLSYQHAFHAGNHADVLKHIVLIAVLEKLNKKAKPYFALDTHAGSGLYDLSNVHEKADATAFDKLNSLSENTYSNNIPLNKYISLISELQAKSIYPGSPYLISYFAREQDKLHANELSAGMFNALEDTAKICKVQGQTLQLHQRDGFEVLKALTPPVPNRGMVLIDPPYEQAKEYQDLVDAISDVLKKWPNGTYMIWYPLLSASRISRTTKQVEDNPKSGYSANMLRKLANLTQQKCSGGLLTVEFAERAPNEKTGMYGSGICLINPPYQIEKDLNEVLAVLKLDLRADNNDLSGLKWLVKPE
ncbi:23S rRNA (adenine(2030)-N(6))-methyltransferase RlmJ [Glaciecola sp. SC05]|uniref:23S rRNA (adenine(2030)-N(6))-methyltransferase RlmJ n=1 Tax=Glaciecola sp. SC05 TaxID=1987355 RepID=UPI00352937F1